MNSDHDLKIEQVPDGDEARLATLGREQALKRHFNVWSLIFMAFCTSVTWEAICSTMTQSLLTGGSSSMVWGFVASAIGALLIALSLSEFASIIPTAGGQYHYVAALSPAKYRRFLSWIAGWVTIWSWILSALAGIFADTMMIQSYIILFAHDYVYQRWHTSLILIALTTLFTLISIVGIHLLHRMMFFGIALHIAGYIATIVYLLVKVHPKNTASFVFSDLTNLSGWKSDGVSDFVFAFLSLNRATLMCAMKHLSANREYSLGCVVDWTHEQCSWFCELGLFYAYGRGDEECSSGPASNL